VAAAAAPVLALLMGNGGLAATMLFMATLIFLRHHENIARLRAGTEPRIGAGRRG